MKSKIAIIGSGWYGSHLASSLLKKGFNVKIFEKNNSIFSEASLNNQNRLHQGFHYPRSFRTRTQSKRGFRLFNLNYNSLLSKIDLSLYAISKTDSLIDFETYKQIMRATELNFEDISNCSPFYLKNIEGIIDCDESLINARKAKKYFESVLSNHTILNQFITKEYCYDLSKNYDMVIDCTWNKIFNEEDIFFEPTIIFKYKKLQKIDFGLTIMDGELCSIYPYDDQYATLSDVEYTPLGKYLNAQEAYKVLEEVTDEMKIKINNEMEQKIKSYFPAFSDYFYGPKPFFSIKTKPLKNKSDDRFTFVKQIEKNIYSVFAGKIDTIFDVEYNILSILQEKNE